MSLQTWDECLSTAQAAGAALANSTATTSLLPTAAKFTLPANWSLIGRMLRLRATGIVSTTGTPTLTFQAMFGATSVWTSGALTMASSITNQSFDLDVIMTVRSIGNTTSATVIGTGRLLYASSLAVLPTTSPVVGTGYDSTASQAVDLQATWSAASASNTITLEQYSLEAMN